MRVFFGALLLSFSVACGDRAQALTRANAAATVLQSWYSKVALNNMWGGAGWWHDANNVEALSTLLLRGGGGTDAERASLLAVLPSVLARQLALKIELNGSTDDVGWWGMAWERAYALTREARYLQRSELCFAHMAKSWDGVCGGGLWWSSERTYKNAITNELFLALGGRLYAATSNTTYLDWARRTWQWFNHSGMINGASMVNDGLGNITASQPGHCVNNGGQTYTYNQGVILGGLVWLHQGEAKALAEARARASTHASATTRAHTHTHMHANASTPLLDAAVAIATATIGSHAWPSGILQEQCDADGTCNLDGNSFKGIFARYVRVLADALEEQQTLAGAGAGAGMHIGAVPHPAAPPASAAGATGATAADLRAWLQRNADAVWAKDRDPTGVPATNSTVGPRGFGPSWEGPCCQTKDKRYRSVATRSALDVMSALL